MFFYVNLHELLTCANGALTFKTGLNRAVEPYPPLDQFQLIGVADNSFAGTKHDPTIGMQDLHQTCEGALAGLGIKI